MAKLPKRVMLLVATIVVFAMATIQFRRYFMSRNPKWLTLLAQDDLDLRSEVHFLNYSYTLADKFRNNIGGDWESFSKEKLVDKCEKFFKFLDSANPDWVLESEIGQGYDKNIIKKLNFMADEFKRISTQKKASGHPDPDKVTKEDEENALHTYEVKLAKTMDMEQKMADSMTVMRMIGHCFYGKERVEMADKLQDIYHRYNKKVSPFLDTALPNFEIGGQVFDHIPGDATFQKGSDLLDYYYSNLKGSGIVISCSTRYSRDIIKFIHVLRAMGNKLPIQFIHRSDLLVKAKTAILSAAFSTKEELLGDQLSSSRILKQMFPNFDINGDEFKNREFPIQNISFVDSLPSLRNRSRAHFGNYNNKIIALFFTTFEHVLLFDADTVPLATPELFLQMKEYTETGAYFFKDRSLRDSNDWIETNFFSKLMPHQSSPLDMAMGVKPVTEHTMANKYMTGWRHYQEAGLVVINKKRHFSALFSLFALALWDEPIKSLIWGDKEMYWLALSMMGDEDYTFNKYDAASIGQVAENKHMLYNNTKAVEVCSSHPGHVHENGELLWINSGFSYCKKNGWARDQKHFPFKVMGKEVLQKLYDEPLKIRLAVVPPELPIFRPVNSPPDLTLEWKTLAEFKKRKDDVDQIDGVDQISNYNPQKGWVKSPCCLNYQYCAYSGVESYNYRGELDNSGAVFTFSEKQQREYDFLGVIWYSAIKQTIEYKIPSLNAQNTVAEVAGSGVPQNTNSEPLMPNPQPSEDEKADKQFMNIFKVEEVEAGEQTSDNTQVLSLQGNVLMGPTESDNKKEETKDMEGKEVKGKEKEVTHSKKAIDKLSTVESNGKNEEDEVEFDKDKVKERPEHLKNNVNELLKKYFASNAPTKTAS